ncbi:glycosyltransferase family 1 protein [Salinibacterium sp. dk2585]|uniref:glycosyltransferase family 4 protein n=1 Tax=unclassified Salinibacterium TaxID=2632331 RepID=UPI0011C24EE1|nr:MULTISPECIES: glycosyltransferase family 1 protein [unclassified Salinibacterium]QEE61622.1 glycosyltransferase family 1 protein [Salinibacterium sp. dk2585]TXK52293.1 glycosyltransferase family 1 protein [Salinibacterium sp. dk5596]
MRIALVAETFLPHMNGVTHSLLRVIDHLAARGDDVLVIAPRDSELPQELSGFDIEGLPALALPSYRNVRIATVTVARVAKSLRRFRPDVVHLASPFVLGLQAVIAAEQLGIPTVAVYQTDVPAYAARYGFRGAEPLLWRQVQRIHQRATLTLAPSSYAEQQLEEHRVTRVRRWGRGVDTERFMPARRDEDWRRAVAPNGERVVGYVGRLASEKQVEDLRVLTTLPHTKLVIVGAGPLRARLEDLMPTAHFTGFLGGNRLATALASFDVFVHPGELETFCQTIQEAMASGVPVVATGRGGPVDLVDSSRNGWLYAPGNLHELRDRVADLVGDDAKRRAFAEVGRASVLPRTWTSLCEELMGHYSESLELHRRRPAGGWAVTTGRPSVTR